MGSDKYDVRVKYTADDADIDANAIPPRKYIIATDEHAQIADQHIFQAANDACCERRIVLCAQQIAVHQHKAHDAAQKKLQHERWFCPMCVIVGRIYIVDEPGTK